jgi:MerR family transcriptional regulator/heat shock protein HspR
VASEQTGARDGGRPTVSSFGPDDDTPVFVISVAAQLAGMHAQTLRQYDRLGLVSPSRTRGGGRRYSGRDVALLREVQRLSQEEGVSLAGIQRILELENQVSALRARVNELGAELNRQAHRAEARAQLESRIFAAGAGGEIVAVRPGQRPPRFPSVSRALVLWQPRLGERHRVR